MSVEISDCIPSLVRLACLIAFTFLAFQAVGAGLLVKDRQQIVMLGDSLTEGEDPDGYVNTTRLILAEVYPNKTFFVANAGKGGDTAVLMDDRLQRDVLRFQPDWVTISAGVNDINHGFSEHPAGDGPKGVPLPLFQEKVRGMIHRIRQNGAKVALFSGTAIQEDLTSAGNKKMDEYSAALREIASETGCVLADTRAAFCDVLRPAQKPGMAQSGVLTGDGVHLIPAGSWLMAKTLLVAWGVPADRIERAKPAVEEKIRRQWAQLRKNLAHYEQANREAGPPKPGEKRIVWVGSGSMERWNLAVEFPNAFMLNRGLSRETTRQLRMRFHQDVVALKPTAAVIYLGSCDDFDPQQRMSLKDTESHLARIARLAKGSGIRLAIAAVTPVNEKLAGKDHAWARPVAEVRRLNAWIQQLCAENGYVFISLHQPVADQRGRLKAEFTDDGCNFNAAGYAALKPALERALAELGQ